MLFKYCKVQSLKRFTFLFRAFFVCLFGLYASFNSTLLFTERSTCVHLALTVRRAFTYSSVRLYYIQADNNTYILCICYSPRLPTKHNVRITPKELRINHSSCVHILLPCVYLSLCARDRSPFTFHKCSSISIQRAFIFSSLCTHRSLSVRSPFTRR